MALGSRGQKNFGLSTNLTLPTVNIDPDPNSDPAVFMPEEKRGGKKKRARFALDRENDEDVEVKVKRKRSWFKRLFTRSKKDPYVVDTHPTPPSTSKQKEGSDDEPKQDRGGEKPVKMTSKSDPKILATRDAQGGKPAEGGQEEKSGKGEQKPKKRRVKSYDRKAKAQSTAFEHIVPVPFPAIASKVVPSTVHVLLKPQSPTNGNRKVVLRHREDLGDGFGVHLSGGLPPVTVTYVEPRSDADLQGVKVGDVVLDVNGLNCRKKVDLTQLMQLKMLVQQTPTQKTAAKDEHIDEATWGKIKTKQDELDEVTSEVKITSLDSPSEDEAPTPAPIPADVKPKRKSPKKRPAKKRPASYAGGNPVEEPLAASSPLKDGATGERKKKKKKKVNGDLSTSKDESELEAVKKRSSLLVEDGKKEKRQSASISVEGNGHSKKKKRESASLSVDESGHSKKRHSTGISVDGNGHISPEGAKKKKKTSKSQSRDSAASLSAPDTSKLSSSNVKVVTAEINDTTQEVRKRKSSKEQRGMEEVDSAHPVDRSDRNRRSSSPKARYRMSEEEKASESKPSAAKPSKKTSEAKAEPEKVTIGVVSKKKNKSKAEGEVQSQEGSGKKASKKSKSKAGGDEKKKKKKKSTGNPPSIKVDDTAEEKAVTEDSSIADPLPPGSAAISGSIESNTMTYVATKHDKPEQQQNATLPRRKSADHSNSSMEGRVSHSTSSSDIRDETEKAFRKELREASRSQHDMKEAIDIDPNIKVKKGGVIKEGRGAIRRPSIFSQSSSPEPEEVTTPVSSGTVEDNILDPEFKMKKSGVVVGRKTSSTTRPSILEEQKEKTPPKDIQPGEMKYNRRVIEDVDGGLDISAIPEISPSLGLVAGRDRLDTVNRSLTKRRPPSIRRNEDETASPSTSRTTAARKLFESKQQEKSEVGRRFSKSIDKPIKTISASQEPATKKPDSSTAVKTGFQATAGGKVGGGEKKGAPSWVTLAQDRQKRSSTTEEKQVLPTATATAGAGKAAPAQRPAGPSSTKTTSKDSSVPEVGTVAMRLAMFQKR